MNSTGRDPKSVRPAGKHLVKEVAQVLCGGWKRLFPRLWMILVVCGIGMLLVLTVNELDNKILNWIALDENAYPVTQKTAKFISDHADIFLAVPLSLAIWGAGVVARRVRWRKIGLACLMATLVAGAVVFVFRSGMGRPRPYAELPDGSKIPDKFYGPHFTGKYYSFPSGHATTSTATAVVIAAAVPITTIPCAAYVVAVGWSRMQLYQHHPIDVIVGTAVGAICGLCFVSTVPRSIVRLRRRKRKRGRT